MGSQSVVTRLVAGAFAASVLAATGSVVAGAAPAASMQVTARTPISIEQGRIISMSPDGTRFVAAHPASDYSHGSLCVYDVATGTKVVCADLSGLGAGLRLEDVTWSPDSTRLAFSELTFQNLHDGDLWLMDASTGALTNLDDDGFSGRIPITSGQAVPGTVSIPASPTFTPDGSSITYSRSLIVDGKPAGDSIVSVPLAGGEPRTLVTLTTGELGVALYGMRWAPDATRLYFSVHHSQRDDPRNGVWVVDADGRNTRLLAGRPTPDSSGPAVLQVASDGAHLLTWDPARWSAYATRSPVFAVVDTTGGGMTELVPLDPDAPAYAFVGWAGLSPDGGSVLTLTNSGNPLLDVWVRDIGATTEHPLVHVDQTTAGWVGAGIALTWAANGTAFLTGSGSFSTATLLTIDGSATASTAKLSGVR